MRTRRSTRLTNTYGSGATATATCSGLCALRPVFRQSLLQIRCILQLWFLRRLASSTTSCGGVTSGNLTLGFCLLELSGDALVVRIENIVWNAFHAEDLDIKTRAVGQGILNFSELFLVDLAHVHR